jgi:hypothetical protein
MNRFFHILIEKRIFRSVTAIMACCTLLCSCNHHRNDPGRDYMGKFDMYYDKAYKPYTENPVFADSLTMQVPPEGSIAQGEIPYKYKAKSMDEQVLAGKELVNPFEVIQGNIDEGREQYELFCLVCHGEKGDGNGPLVQTGKYPAKPRSLIDSYVQNKPDGEVFHVITMGSVSGLMGSYGTQVHLMNRWKIVLYIRELSKH